MADNQFQGKQPQEISDAIAGARSGEQVDSMFAALQSLGSYVRRQVVDLLEKDLIKETTAMAQEGIDLFGPEGAKAVLAGDGEPEGVALCQAMAQMFLHVSKSKGDAAHPLVKAYVEEVAKLSDEQYNSSAGVMGAAIDALLKTSAPSAARPNPFTDEKSRLVKIDEALGWRVSLSVKEHFNQAGKYEAFAAARTEAENRAQMDAIRGILYKSGAEAALATLKATDIFMGVARRVGKDSDLAALLPVNKLAEKDAEILEKHQLKSLAVLVKIALQNKPK